MNQNNSSEQEIDLLKVFNSFFISFSNFFNKSVLIVKNNFLKFLILIVLGFILGLFIGKVDKRFNNKIIVQANFGSVDYLYNKINLIQSKLQDNDSLFFKEIGINKYKNIKLIKIEPIIDVYSFVSSEGNKNFEMLQLQAEDGSISKIIEDKNTSKYYKNHLITFKTSSINNYEQINNALLNFLNKSDFFDAIKKQYNQNILDKNLKNIEIIAQIDGVLNQFSNNISDSKSDKLIYYNENTQLNDVIKSKSELIEEVNNNKLYLLKTDEIIKDLSITNNILDTKNLSNNYKLVFPFIFCLFLYLFYFIKLNKK